ncbi:hypothetical protein AB0I81_43960 [Nonomuraea sp. NPDC050404]|uniref:hypothetical protein n=1 Tax=Nonomuraea sp. NPDC050404 TaxID=3155783 RepID=UPI003410EDC3
MSRRIRVALSASCSAAGRRVQAGAAEAAEAPANDPAIRIAYSMAGRVSGSMSRR